MRKTILQRALSIFAMTVLAILCAACPDGFKAPEQYGKAKVIISVMDDPVRTVLPQVSLADVASYKLLGGNNGASETEIAEFTTGATSVSLIPGIWNFTLNAYNSSGGHILQGKVQNQQINLTGTNQVNFSLSVINSGVGAIQITLEFPASAGITQINTSGDIVSDEFNNINSGNFVYSKNGVIAGDYLINFGLYCGDILRVTISELVLVRSNLTSSKTITLTGEDLKRTLSGTISISPDIAVTVGTELTVIYSGTETVNYQWNKDGSAVSGATGGKYTPTSTGVYTVTVSAAGYDNKTSAVVTVVGSAVTVPGTTLQAQLEWLANTATSYSSYILEASADEEIPPFNLFYPDRSNIVITIKGTDSPQTISLSSNGAMFTVEATITLILDNNITLQGRSSNNAGLVIINSGGALVMNTGSVITGNTANRDGGGVYVYSYATFTMHGGEISGNTANRDGGGVYVYGGSFRIVTGTIYGSGEAEGIRNTATNSGAALYRGSGTAEFGTFSGNTWNSNGTLGTTDDTIRVVNGVLSGAGTPRPDNYVFNVATVAEWNSALGSIAAYGSNKNYTINVTADFFVTGRSTPSFGGASGVTVTLQGPGRTVSLSGNGSILRIDANQTVILQDLSLRGHDTNNTSLVYVAGTNATFTMSGGEISGNTASSSSSGGGVYVYSYATFTMHGGEISSNASSSSSGGGVYVYGGTFTMHGGEISGNASSSYVSSSGGGVYVSGGSFTMNGGEITGNTSPSCGGGVSVSSSGGFRIVTGTIYGSGEAEGIRNTATEGAALYRSSGIAEFGTFSGNTWNSNGTLGTTDDTIRVVNGNRL